MMSRVRDADASPPSVVSNSGTQLGPVRSFCSSAYPPIPLTGTGRAYSAPGRTDTARTEYYVVRNSSCGTPTSSTSSGHYPGWYAECTLRPTSGEL